MKNLTLYFGIQSLLTLKGAVEKKGRHLNESDLGEVKKAAILEHKGKVFEVGEEKKIRALIKKNKWKVKREIDLKVVQVLPGLIDCHTHLVFGGDRISEFELRNTGVSYQEIAARGGGILSTMKATRRLSEQKLLKESQDKIDLALRQGITTCEIKSGYALNLKDELKQLKVAQKLKGPRIIPTFLGAHAKPPEFSNYSEYLNYLIETVLPEVKKKRLSQRCDIFLEKGFFDFKQAHQFLSQAQSMGFQLTVHADQLTLSGGTQLAIELKALSADHVIQIQDREIKMLADSETTAVCLPAADLYMKCAYPPARKMIDEGVRVALATDFNPGSCPTQDLNLVGVLARLYMQMSLPEVISGFTVNAAFALGLENQIGSLKSGTFCDFVVSRVHWSKLFYQIGSPWVEFSVIGGHRNILRSR